MAALELLVRCYILQMHDFVTRDAEIVKEHMEFLEAKCGIKLISRLHELYVPFACVNMQE